MFVPLAVFVLVVGAVLGGYAAVTALPAFMAGRQLDRRLRDVSIASAPDAQESDSTIVKRAEHGPLPSLDRFVSKTNAGSWLSKLIDQSGTKTTVSGVMVMSLAAGVATAFVTSMFVRVPFAALVVGLLGAVAPFGWLRHRRTKRLKKFEEMFPEALDLLSRAIRAGHAFQTAMGMVADELKEPVGPEFKKTFDQQNFGLPLREALAQMAERVPLLDVRFFVTAVLIQRDTGGNLSEILDNLAHVVRERFKILRQVRVHTAHGRFTGYVLLALPAALGMALSVINPEHMGVLFHEHLGQMLLLAAMVLQTVGFLWIRQVIKIEV
jgi:tight adherence protein B